MKIMCEANAYLVKGEDEELFFENVDRIMPQDDGLLLEDIFGKKKLVKAKIKEIREKLEMFFLKLLTGESISEIGISTASDILSVI
jgi:predicted RNA-binding protein